MLVFTVNSEKTEWAGKFESSCIGSESSFFWAKVTKEDDKHYWLIASKRMGYTITFCDAYNVCIEIPTEDITKIMY